MADTMIAVAGVVAPTLLGLVVSHPLLGLVVSLSVAVLLLLIAGTHIERQLHGDSGIELEPRVRGQWIELSVTNNSGKIADLGATVEAVEPLPAPQHIPSWIIPWVTCAQARQTIDPRNTHYLRLRYGELSRRASDGELAGSVVFDGVGTGGVPFNYENTAECRERVPIKITVRVYRVSPRTSIERRFEVGLDFDDDSDRALPRIKSVTVARSLT